MKSFKFTVILIIVVMVFSFTNNSQYKVKLSVYNIDNEYLARKIDSIITFSINCEKFPQNIDWYISSRKITDTTNTFYEISISIVNKDFLFTYTSHDDIKGMINYNKDVVIYILNDYPENLFIKTVNTKYVVYKNLKGKGKFNIKPITEYPVWYFKYFHNQFFENKFNKYECE